MKRTLPIFLLYCLITFALTHPLVRQLGSAFPHDPGDPALNTWILWWNAQTIPLTAAWWNAPAFYPIDGVLSFSETLLGLTVLSTPMQWLGSSPLVAYNVIFLLTFPLCAIAAYLLGFEITRRRDAAFVAGALFAFAPYRMSHLPHLQVLAAFGMPIALFALHRYLRDPRARWLLLFAAAWLWQGLTNGYYLLFFSVLVGMWMLWFVPPTTAPRSFRAILIASALAALPLLPILWQYKRIHEPLGFVRDFGTIRQYGADALALLSTDPNLWLWGWLQVYRGAEGQIFPGLTILLLVIASLWVGWRHRTPGAAFPQGAALRIVRRVLWVVAIVTGIIAIAVRGTDPWQIRLFGMQLLSIGNPVKPLTWALASAMILMITSAPVRRAWSQRSVLGFYAVAAVVLWVLCLGPAPTWMGEPLMYRGPYALLMSLPGFNSLRVPARFWMLSVLCLSVVGAMLFNRLGARIPAARGALAALVVLGVIAEGWMTFPVAPVPQVWSPHGCTPPRGPEGAVLELPMGGVVEDVGAMYRSMSHRRPTVNGYSGYFPPHYFALRYGLAAREPGILKILAAHGLEYVVIDRGYQDEGALRQYVLAHQGVTPVCANETHAVFHVAPATIERQPTRPLPIAGLSANINQVMVDSMSDGDIKTRWVTGPQESGMMLEIDLGRPRVVAELELSLGSSANDFPRGLRIEASDDRSAWRKIWRGASAARALIGALEDPVSIPLRYDLRSTRTRFLRLWLTEDDDTFFWSIAELQVLGP